MIDWNRVRELREEVGEQEFRPILELFLDEMETISFRLASDDPARMEIDFHFLKNCARNLGLMDFARICEEAERQVISGGAQMMRLDEIRESYARTKSLFMHGLAAETARRFGVG